MLADSQAGPSPDSSGTISGCNAHGAPRGRWLVWVLTILALAISSFIGMRLGHEDASSRQATEIGKKIRLLRVRDDLSKYQTIHFDGTRKTVLYVVNPDCRWCAANAKSIKQVASERKDEYSFVGLSLSHPDLERYRLLNRYPFPLFELDSAMAIAPIDITATPQTLVIEADGTVSHEWLGAYSGDVKKDVERFFRISLPDLHDEN